MLLEWARKMQLALAVFSQCYTFCDVVYGYCVLTATSTSTALPTTARRSPATPESTALTSAKTSGKAVEAVVYLY